MLKSNTKLRQDTFNGEDNFHSLRPRSSSGKPVSKLALAGRVFIENKY